MHIVFLGTPSFAAHPLRRLVAAGHEVVAVVTQPDRPVGRSRTPQPSPVKQAARELGLPLMQPETLRDEAVIAHLRALHRTSASSPPMARSCAVPSSKSRRSATSIFTPRCYRCIVVRRQSARQSSTAMPSPVSP